MAVFPGAVLAVFVSGMGLPVFGPVDDFVPLPADRDSVGVAVVVIEGIGGAIEDYAFEVFGETGAVGVGFVDEGDGLLDFDGLGDPVAGAGFVELLDPVGGEGVTEFESCVAFEEAGMVEEADLVDIGRNMVGEIAGEIGVAAGPAGPHLLIAGDIGDIRDGVSGLGDVEEQARKAEGGEAMHEEYQDREQGPPTGGSLRTSRPDERIVMMNAHKVEDGTEMRGSVQVKNVAVMRFCE